MQWRRGIVIPRLISIIPGNMTTSSAEETPWGSRNWRRPTPVVTRSISSRISSISEIGDDLLVEILIRSFPDPESASRCKAVCKQWSSLISSPCFNRSFVSHHQKKNKKKTKPLLHNELVSVISSFLPPMPDRVEGEILHVFDCFKDLVLCGVRETDRYKRKSIRQYLICNPFTQKWIALPLAPGYLRDQHLLTAARLVCEPRISTNLDLGGDDQEQEVFVYSQYRFRVVLAYDDSSPMSIKLDVFCSESGEWIRDALSLPGYKLRLRNVYPCNGKLFWTCFRYPTSRVRFLVGMFNPFRLDIPPTFIDTSTTLLGPGSTPMLTVSQDALHLIPSNNNIFAEPEPGLVIWRLDVEEDGKYSWRKQRQVLKKKKNNKCWCGSERKALVEPPLQSSNSNIVFFQCFACRSSLYSLDLSREEGEVELLGQLDKVASHPFFDFYKVFEPSFSCWPTPIPKYKELP